MTKEHIIVKIGWQRLLDFFKKMRSIGQFLLLLLFIFVVAFAMGNKLLALVSLFFLLGIISRLPAIYNDAIKETEIISDFAFFIVLIGGPLLGAAFAFSAMWASWLLAPWREAEDVVYVIMDSIGMVGAALATPLIFSFTGGILMPSIFYFIVVRYGIYMALIPFIKPATLHTSGFLTVVGFFIAIPHAYIITKFFGPGILGWFGITGFKMGVLPFFGI